MEANATAHEHQHPGPAIYVKIALTLFGATILVLHQHFSRVLLLIYVIAAVFLLLNFVHVAYILRSLFSVVPSTPFH